MAESRAPVEAVIKMFLAEYRVFLPCPLLKSRQLYEPAESATASVAPEHLLLRARTSLQVTNLA